jgi:hypothetical protein
MFCDMNEAAEAVKELTQKNNRKNKDRRYKKKAPSSRNQCVSVLLGFSVSGSLSVCLLVVLLLPLILFPFFCQMR